MAHELTSEKHSTVGATTGRSRRRGSASKPRTSESQIWAELDKASFAIIGYVTPSGEPRSSGVVYSEEDRHLYCAVAPQSWKAGTVRRSR